MTEKLIDPSLDRFHLFDENDGVIIRNDRREFKSADKNPWYVLATIFDGDDAKNRRAWNGWACAGMDADARQKLADEWQFDVAELKPWDTKEKAAILKRFRARMGQSAQLPDPSERINMSKTAFLKPLGFEKRYFSGSAYFGSSHFAGSAVFFSSHFAGSAVFFSSHFAGDANFGSSHFAGSANFASSHFAGSAYFASSHFAGDAYFGSSHFAGDAYFGSSHFASFAYFGSSHFASFAYFGSSHFASFANFASIEMKGKTSFTRAVFKTHVPVFHGAKLNRDTVFPTAEPASLNYPVIMPEGKEKVGDKEYMPATDQKRAYNTLRYFMNQNLEIDQELFFHRREMACKEVTEKGIVGWMIWVYGKISSYGSSIERPLGVLFAVWFIGFIAMLSYLIEISGPETVALKGQAAGISFSNVFSFFGFGRLFLKEFFDLAPMWVTIIAGVQTVCGFIFLFLLGLGIRSRFRLR